jgi:hypothetical protein
LLIVTISGGGLILGLFLMLLLWRRYRQMTNVNNHQRFEDELLQDKNITNLLEEIFLSVEQIHSKIYVLEEGLKMIRKRLVKS